MVSDVTDVITIDPITGSVLINSVSYLPRSSFNISYCVNNGDSPPGEVSTRLLIRSHFRVPAIFPLVLVIEFTLLTL